MRTGIEPAKAEVKAQLPVSIRATAPSEAPGCEPGASKTRGGSCLERTAGFEPASSLWKSEVLGLWTTFA